MCPPVGSPLKLKLMSIYLPKRLELSFRFVLAFPKASSTQLDLSSTFFTLIHQGTTWPGRRRRAHVTFLSFRWADQSGWGLPLHLDPLTRVCDGSDVLHNVFTGLCLSSSTFTWKGFDGSYNNKKNKKTLYSLIKANLKCWASNNSVAFWLTVTFRIYGPTEL